MKLFDIRVGEFINLLEHAQGNISLITEDGVAFNLSSKLSQLYCVKLLIRRSAGNFISPELEFEKPEDEEMFAAYFHMPLRGNERVQPFIVKAI